MAPVAECTVANGVITHGPTRRTTTYGKVAAVAMEKAGLVCNYNSVPFDKRKPFDPSGIRLGTPAWLAAVALVVTVYLVLVALGTAVAVSIVGYRALRAAPATGG